MDYITVSKVRAYSMTEKRIVYLGVGSNMKTER